MTLGTWLRQRRAALGVTQDQFARRLGFSPAMLRKLESGERRPSGQIAHLLADYFRIPADEREAFVAFARSLRTPSHDHASVNTNATTPWRHGYIQHANLPAMLTPLLGREVEVERVHEQLLNPRVRLLTLTGMPGIGKTRLALQVASDMVEHFEDGVFFVDLAPIFDPGLVLPTVGRALGLKDEANRTSEEVLVDFLSERRMMLLLDNFEQVLDAAAQVVQMLQASPWLKVLVTSREALRVRAERRYQVPPLGMPRPGQAPRLEDLAGFPAVQLFVERAQAVDPTFALNEANAYAIVGICERLGGLPLSIELITARIRLFDPNTLMSRLEHVGDLALLSGDVRDLPPRHRSLRGAIAWSYNLLSGQEQAVFRRLGVFAGGFTAEAASAVCEGLVGMSAEAVEVVSSLLDKSLLTPVEEHAHSSANIGPSSPNGWRPATKAHAEPRYMMLATIREYALEQLREKGDEDDVRRRHTLYFAEMAEQAEPELKRAEQTVWLRRLDGEYSNIQAALEWGAEADPEVTIRLMFALRRYWHIRGRWAENSKWLEMAMERADELPPLVRAKALRMANAYNTRQEILNLEESAALARQAGSHALLSESLGQLGYHMIEQGNRPRARELFEECLVLDRELGDKYGICWVLTALGEIARLEKNYPLATEYYQEGLSLAREEGNKYNIAMLVVNLAWVTIAQDPEKATALVRESLDLALELQYNIGIVVCMAASAAIASECDRPERAATLAGAVEQLQKTLNVQIDVADRQEYEQYLGRARNAMGEEAYREAFGAGLLMTMQQALAYALEGVQN